MTDHEERFELDASIAELRANMHQAAQVDLEYLQGEFVRMPALLSVWSSKCAQAHGELLRAKARTKRLRGLFEIRERKTLERKRGHGSKNVSESMVAAHVELCEDWQEAYEDEIAATVTYEEHKGHLDALHAKRDMLMQLGADRRKEMELDPTIRVRRDADRYHNRQENSSGEDE